MQIMGFLMSCKNFDTPFWQGRKAFKFVFRGLPENDSGLCVFQS